MALCHPNKLHGGRGLRRPGRNTTMLKKKYKIIPTWPKIKNFRKPKIAASSIPSCWRRGGDGGTLPNFTGAKKWRQKRCREGVPAPWQNTQEKVESPCLPIAGPYHSPRCIDDYSKGHLHSLELNLKWWTRHFILYLSEAEMNTKHCESCLRTRLL